MSKVECKVTNCVRQGKLSKDHTKRYLIKGFCYTHYTRILKSKPLEPETIEERFWSKVEKTDTCWLWTGNTNYGYGMFSIGKRTIRAHRYSYELLSTIPNGLVIDHLCRVKNCVNPDHLDAVTVRENTVRGNVHLNKKDNLPVGVTKRDSKYIALKRLGDKYCYLGRYNTPEDASIAYQTACYGGVTK